MPGFIRFIRTEKNYVYLKFDIFQQFMCNVRVISQFQALKYVVLHMNVYWLLARARAGALLGEGCQWVRFCRF